MLKKTLAFHYSQVDSSNFSEKHCEVWFLGQVTMWNACILVELEKRGLPWTFPVQCSDFIWTFKVVVRLDILGAS